MYVINKNKDEVEDINIIYFFVLFIKYLLSKC